MAAQGRLIVVSNRGPYRAVGTGSKRKWVRSSGGLVSALVPVLRDRSGVWVSAQEAEEHGHAPAAHLDYELASVSIPKKVQEGFYQGVSNALLWPLLHSFPPTMRVAEAPWERYRVANEAFAEQVLSCSEERDVIWVQDYQLMLVPGLVRRSRPNGRIGWFCHVPWPSSDLFAILPWRLQILNALLQADVLGFHTASHVDNFLQCVERLTGYSVDHVARTVQCDGRLVRVLAAPIGIAVEDVRNLASDPEVLGEAARLRDLVGKRKLILGVDRLDYTKGIPERLLAYEQLLQRYRSARDKWVYVQIMVPSRVDVRAYAELKREVDRLVGSINGRFGATGKVPLHYLYRSLPQKQLYAHYRAADVALVTPLRDGMNLVAHEYVASRLDVDGVLVLSEFAGAAEYLKDALQVNPYDIGAIADTLELALQIPIEEARGRMNRLRASVNKLDVHRWAQAFLDVLET